MYLVDVITFLDAHSGAIIGISTGALVGATLILAYLNRQLWLSQDKPILYFTTKLEEITPTPSGIKVPIGGREIELVRNGYYVLYVKNIGKGPAFEIHFDVPGIVERVYCECLMPNEEHKITRLPEVQYVVSGLEYKDLNGKKIKKKPILDLGTKARMDKI